MNPPGYFNRVATNAVDLWEKLKDPVLAGPWRQLFAQVQSPRHVLSELLQNADDAGAKSASVRVEDNEFVFEHDGGDFTAEQFESLCRFGYSNKRNLHTIGFRGVGFKSTFSLGYHVRIQTPTLDVSFDRDRFTLPVWSSNPSRTKRTRISVRFADRLREQQLRMNFHEWATSPVSLLFFRNLQQLAIESQTIRKEVLTQGPITGSQRIRLIGANTGELVLIRSLEEPFPESVVAEIRQERNADDLHLPPCSVELVLGLDGDQRLFVVLPAGTNVHLPFSINAPFLQDPARQKIKEPEVSPCNRWLLKRAGRLAAEAMVEWLGRDGLQAGQRADAYELLRGPVANAADLTTSATKLVMDAMLAALEDKPVILTTDEHLTSACECAAVPMELHAVWDAQDLTRVFAPAAEHLLSPTVGTRAASVLEAHGWIRRVTNESALEALKLRSIVPTPTWARLQALWHWVQKNIGWDWNGERRRALRIVPVSEHPSLHSGNEVIRVSSRGQQLADADWDFISDFALAIDQDWIDHLNKLKTKNEGEPLALQLLEAISLHEPSPVDRIAAQASRRLLTRGEMPVGDCVRMAHIFAALNATVPEDFQYVSEDRNPHQIKAHPIVFDAYGDVEAIVPNLWAAQHLLHPDYVADFKSCTRERWFEWAYSSKSRLHAFVPLMQQAVRLNSRRQLGEFLIARTGENPKEYYYRNDRFIIDDFDFPPELLAYWQLQAATRPDWWAAVAKGLLADPMMAWKNSFRITVRQVSSQGSSRPLNCGSPVPAWLVRLRSLPCLTDRHGIVQTPSELLLRTADTESLLDLEPFVAAELDATGDQKDLLRWLGVRDTATGWAKVVDRLRGLSQTPDTMRVLVHVLRLYEALDRIATRCASDDLVKLRSLFASEPLVLSNTLEWLSSGELSLHPDPESGSPVVHSAAQGLALWLRLGVPERPALERTIEWLNSLESGAKLDATAAKRVRTTLQRDPVRLWNECRHWLTLDSTWVAVADLKYRLTMQSLKKLGELFPAIKGATANLQMVSLEVAQLPPFASIPNLGDAVEFRVTRFVPGSSTGGPTDWLSALALGLCRVKLSSDEETHRIRSVAQRLYQIEWNTFAHLDVTPYVEGAPAGEPFTPKVLWQDAKLYVASQSTVRLYKDLADELARPFNDNQIVNAIAACIDRTPAFVAEYLEAHFVLDAQPELPVQDEKATEATEAGATDFKPPSQEDSPAGADEVTAAAENTAPTEGDGAAGDGDDDGEHEVGDEKEESKPPTPLKPSLIALYAKQRGFKFHAAEKCFTHPDGRWIEKSESPFNWEERAAGGELVSRMWVADQKLANGVEILAEFWSLIGQQPGSTMMIIAGDDHAPCALTGQELLELKDSRQITLHPARYRIVENNK